MSIEDGRKNQSEDFIRNHVYVVRPGMSEDAKLQNRGMKI